MIVKRLVVKNGTYTKDGEEKSRWLHIGAIHEHEGREYITLDRHVNLAGLPTKEGETRVFVSMFDEEKRDAAPAAKKPAGKLGKVADPFDDDIPF